jgi:hypothetical protein
MPSAPPSPKWEDRMAKQTFESRITLEHLEEQHRMLARQVEYLDRRSHLTPAEQREATDLKKRKLATKDAISALRSRSN